MCILYTKNKCEVYAYKIAWNYADFKSCGIHKPSF
jgi:hypothetical protein